MHGAAIMLCINSTVCLFGLLAMGGREPSASFHIDFYGRIALKPRCGPMKQLKAMMKRIDAEAWKKTQNIHV